VVFVTKQGKRTTMRTERVLDPLPSNVGVEQNRAPHALRGHQAPIRSCAAGAG
jgi:hypothetical protein